MSAPCEPPEALCEQSAAYVAEERDGHGASQSQPREQTLCLLRIASAHELLEHPEAELGICGRELGGGVELIRIERGSEDGTEVEAPLL